jgi:hypothetical protein
VGDGFDPLALGVVPTLHEPAVGWEVQLAVDVQDTALANERLGVMEAASPILDEADRHEHGARRLHELPKLRRIARPSEPREVGLQDVIGERQFGKEEEVRAALPCFPDCRKVQREIAGNVSRPALDLRRGDRETGHGRNASTKVITGQARP